MPPKGSRTAMPLPKEADAARKREKRGAEARAQAAKKVKLQGAVFPTSNAERMKESYEPSSEAHGGSREHAGRPRELSRGQRDYENMVAVATKQRLLWDTQNAAAGDAALGAYVVDSVATLRDT